MKKYLMFMLCVVFAVSFVCCGGRGSRENAGRQVQVNPESPAAPTHTDAQAPTAPTLGEVPVVERFTERIKEGARFIFEGCTFNEGKTECTICIAFVDKDGNIIERVCVTLNVAQYMTAFMQANAKDIGTFDDDDNNLYIVVTVDGNSDYFLFLFCGRDETNIVTYSDLTSMDTDLNFVGSAKVDDELVEYKYWRVRGNSMLAEDENFSRTIHLYVMERNKNKI